jgi:hypothetical protein
MSNQTSSTILPFIKSLINENICFSFHSKIRVKEKGFTENEIKKILFESLLLGSIFQENGKFKLIFQYSKEKDLHIIVNPDIDKVNIITLFLKEKKWRIRD